MIYKISTSPKVKNSVDLALFWYKEISTKVAKKFEKELRKTYSYIEKNPYQFQVRYDNIRIAFLKKFPFGIHYVVTNNTIVVLSVFHTSQNSQNWTKS